ALLGHEHGGLVSAALFRELCDRLLAAAARHACRRERVSRRDIPAAEDLGRADLLEAGLLERGRPGRALRCVRAARSLCRRAAQEPRAIPLTGRTGAECQPNNAL